MLTEMSQQQEKIFALLLMRFKVSPSKSLLMIEEWMNQHPQESYETLEASLRNSLIKVQNDKLTDLYSPEIRQLVNKMRGENGLEIKNRNYRLKTYPKCFIGSEAVQWLMKTYQTSKAEAIKLGQNLIEQRIIHHVTDDHDFKSDNLFYRFYLDE